MNPAAPKSIFRPVLICAASFCLTAFAPAAFAQSAGSHASGGGSHGGGGSHAGSSHGGSVGGAHGGSSGASHAGFSGGFHAGSASGPYAGSSVSTQSGSATLPAPARMSSSSVGHGFNGASGNYTGNTFIAPPTATQPVEGAARTIFINANGRPVSANTTAPTGARPFAAGNYLWAAPPQQARQHVATPPPSAPRPVNVPSPQPIHPTVMQPPSPIRPMSMPTPIPRQGPRPFQIPARMPVARPGAIPVSPMPTPISRPVGIPPPMSYPLIPARLPVSARSSRFGTRFISPAISGPRPVAPAPRAVLLRPVPPLSHPLPVRPPFAGMALESTAKRRPIAFTAFGSSTATPPHPCINTIARCGFGGGVLDGDGDFDNDGFGFGSSIFFGFLGPFGFSPLGFGSTCIFNGFFQDCFLSPVGFSPFGFGAFGPFGLYGPWYGGYDFSPYGSSFLFLPPVENLTPAFGDYLPNTNYAPSYTFEPEPLPVPEDQSPPANASTAAQPIVDLVLKDGTVFGVTSYWLLNDRLFYITTYQIQSSIPIDQLDLQKTVDMNYKRGVAFTLTPQPPDQQPPQDPQPHQ